MVLIIVFQVKKVWGSMGERSTQKTLFLAEFALTRVLLSLLRRQS